MPATVDRTLNTANPLLLEFTEAGEIVSVDPRLEARVTLLPEIGLLLESSRVTVTVEAEFPSAVTEEGEALIVEVDRLTAPATKVTEAVEVRVRLAVESVAVKVDTPAEVELTVKVTFPEVSEGPEALDIVSPPRLEARVTVLPGAGLLEVSRRVTVMIADEVPSAVKLEGEELTVDLEWVGTRETTLKGLELALVKPDELACRT